MSKLPPEGQAQSDPQMNAGPDPLIAFASRLLDTIFSVPGLRYDLALSQLSV